MKVEATEDAKTTQISTPLARQIGVHFMKPLLQWPVSLGTILTVLVGSLNLVGRRHDGMEGCTTHLI